MGVRQKDYYGASQAQVHIPATQVEGTSAIRHQHGIQKTRDEKMYLPLQTLGIPGWIRRVRRSMDTKTRIRNWRRTRRGQISSRIRLKRKSSEEPTNWCRHWYPRFT